MAVKGVAGGVGGFQSVAGIGAEAYAGPMGSSLMFHKGDVMANRDLRRAGDHVEAAEGIAQKIVGRL